MRRCLRRACSRFSFFLREFFADYVQPGTTCACHDFVHASVFYFAVMLPPNLRRFLLLTWFRFSFFQGEFFCFLRAAQYDMRVS